MSNQTEAEETTRSLWHPEDLGGVWQMEPAKPYVDDLWQDTMTRNAVGLFTGVSGSYKTFNVMRILKAFIAEKHLLGRDINRNGGVVYLAYEGQESIRPRIDALMIDAGETDYQIPFAAPLHPAMIRDDEAYNEFEDALAAVATEYESRFGAPLVFVVVDTLIASGMLKDENDPNEWQWALSKLKRIAERLDIAIGLVVHAGKNAASGQRGSSAGYAAADFEISFTCFRDNKTGHTGGRLVSMTKVREGGRAGPMAAMSIKSVEVGHTLMGRVKTAGVIQYDTTQQAIDAAIAEQDAFAAGRKGKKTPAADNPDSKTFQDLLVRRARRNQVIDLLFRARLSETVTRDGRWELYTPKANFDALFKETEAYQTIGANKKRMYDGMMKPKKRSPFAKGEPEPPELTMDSSGHNFVLNLPTRPGFLSLEPDARRDRYGDDED